MSTRLPPHNVRDVDLCCLIYRAICSAVVRDLSVLDSELSMKQHISKVASTCYYHMRKLRDYTRFADYVSRKTMTQLVMFLVMFRIDYCSPT